MSVHGQIVSRPIASLQPAHRNVRTHSRKQVRQIADSIERFGFVTPILIDKELQITSGHGRWQGAKLLGLAEVPTLIVDLSPEELRAFAIADNRLASLAGWDNGLLALELAELELLAPEIDLTVTGFTVETIEIMKDIGRSKKQPKPEPTIAISNGPVVTRAGDLWVIGQHLLLCGDALEPASFQRLLQGRLADVVVTDPPYNVPIAGHVTSRAHREFEMASGEMSRSEFQRFLSTICRLLVRYSRSGSLHYLFMDWRSISDLVGAGEEHYDALLNVLVWVKPQGSMGTFYRSRHELVALFRNGTRAHTNNVQLGVHGRTRTNVWEYPGVAGFGPERELGTLHPTVKNLDMIADAIRDSSCEGELVLDPFGGSGTTLIAAQRTGRHGRLIELDPVYCDLIVRRAHSEGLSATLADDSRDFADVAQDRLGSGDNAGCGQ